MDNTVRIVMVGKTGVGKSATGNTILGCKPFVSKSSAKSVTVDCTLKQAVVCGKTMKLVDTPGLFDTSLPNEQIEAEIGRCVDIAAPGPHVFLIVVQAGRFTKEEQHAAEVIKQIFGKDINDFAIVLLTRGDDLEADGVTIDEFYNNAGPELKALIKQCGGRYHAFNNRSEDREQVKELMEKVQNLMKQNGRCYTSALFEMVTKVNEMKRELEEEKKKKDNDAEKLMRCNSDLQKQIDELKKCIVESRQRAQPICTIS